MNLAGLIKSTVYDYSKPRNRSNNKKHETKKDTLYISNDLYGDNHSHYYIGLINLIDRAILDDNMYALSIEQEKLLTEYFLVAKDYVPDASIDLDSYEYDFSNMVLHLQELDEFLGGYMGEEDDEYSRYGKKQLYSQRQYIGA